MENKITLTICSGTVCYVMGGTDLLSIGEKIPADIKEKVFIKGSPCLGYCKDTKNGKPPFAEVNGEKISEASVSKILETLKRHFKG